MRADMSGRSAAEMIDSQELPELPVSLHTMTPNVAFYSVSWCNSNFTVFTAAGFVQTFVYILFPSIVYCSIVVLCVYLQYLVECTDVKYYFF